MKMKTKHKISHILACLGFCLIVIIWLVFMFWWIYPYKTSTQVQPYKVITHEVKQGELLKYEMEYCKYTTKIPTVERQFIDGIIYTVPQGNAQIKKGCGKIVNSILIPQALPIGTYYVHSTVSWKMNPVRIINQEFITEKFIVTK